MSSPSVIKNSVSSVSACRSKLGTWFRHADQGLREKRETRSRLVPKVVRLAPLRAGQTAQSRRPELVRPGRPPKDPGELRMIGGDGKAVTFHHHAMLAENFARLYWICPLEHDGQQLADRSFGIGALMLDPAAI